MLDACVADLTVVFVNSVGLVFYFLFIWCFDLVAVLVSLFQWLLLFLGCCFSLVPLFRLGFYVCVVCERFGVFWI